ncbi:hypothetical protein G6F22_020330 [Rhizopus arrhizus]|nr:hypothetical protein G6F22_020330 [Rhizopus arrhizus]
MHDRYLHAPRSQSAGRFQAEQPATDHDGVPVTRRRFDHPVHIADIAEGDDAAQVVARHRQDERVRAGRQQQPVIRRFGSVIGAHDAAQAVHLRHLAVAQQADAVAGVPGLVVQHDVLQGAWCGARRRTP